MTNPIKRDCPFCNTLRKISSLDSCLQREASKVSPPSNQISSVTSISRSISAADCREVVKVSLIVNCLRYILSVIAYQKLQNILLTTPKATDRFENRKHNYSDVLYSFFSKTVWYHHLNIPKKNIIITDLKGRDIPHCLQYLTISTLNCSFVIKSYLADKFMRDIHCHFTTNVLQTLNGN